MELLEQQLTRRLEQVDIFGDAHRSVFAAKSRALALFDELKTVIADLKSAQDQQSASGSGAVGSTRTKSAILGELRRDMNRIAGTARQMQGLSDVQRDVFGRAPSRESEVVSQAKVFLQTATPIWAQFVAYESPTDLLGEMQSDLDDYNAAFAAQQSGTQARVGAGTSIENALERGGEILDELRPIIQNKSDGEDAVLREWASAVRYPARDKTRAKPVSVTS